MRTTTAKQRLLGRAVGADLSTIWSTTVDEPIRPETRSGNLTRDALIDALVETLRGERMLHREAQVAAEGAIARTVELEVSLRTLQAALDAERIAHSTTQRQLAEVRDAAGTQHAEPVRAVAMIQREVDELRLVKAQTPVRAPAPAPVLAPAHGQRFGHHALRNTQEEEEQGQEKGDVLSKIEEESESEV